MMDDLFTKGGFLLLIILFSFLLRGLMAREPYQDRQEKDDKTEKNTYSSLTKEEEYPVMPRSFPKFEFEQDLHPMRYQGLNIIRNYALYNPDSPSPKGYHRYGSNLCDPTQDELPITFPDPNADLPPFECDPLVMQLKYGSMPCGTCNQLNYCQ